jgi:23S rRNA C2498 (ribose-2'-O)-methylase RlmM
LFQYIHVYIYFFFHHQFNLVRRSVYLNIFYVIFINKKYNKRIHTHIRNWIFHSYCVDVVIVFDFPIKHQWLRLNFILNKSNQFNKSELSNLYCTTAIVYCMKQLHQTIIIHTRISMTELLLSIICF